MFQKIFQQLKGVLISKAQWLKAVNQEFNSWYKNMLNKQYKKQNNCIQT